MFRSVCLTCLLGLVAGPPARADVPVASYLFPAGGQRGTTVAFKVGGLNLHQECGFEMLGAGVEASRRLRRVPTLWFEGPVLPLPESQQAEDYPKDFAGEVRITADAPLGVRWWRTWTSQGATPALPFDVGDLPEVLEEETDGSPGAVAVRLPVTINGRIFPREDVDVWAFAARRGQSVACTVRAARLGTPLDARLEVLDPHGRRLAENDDTHGADPFVRFTAPADGTYQVRIHDIQFRGGQAYVYRLTLTSDAYVERVYPLGGRRGSRTAFEMIGQGLPTDPTPVALPADGPQEYTHRLTVQGKSTNPFPIELDDLAEHLETEPNDTPDSVQPSFLPAVCNGRIGKAGDVDFWAFSARKSEVLEIDLRASRLDSTLQGVLVVVDASGKELARAESGAAALSDPSLRFTAPSDGTYWVRVADRFASRGGPAFAYRLRVAPPEGPGFRLQLATDALTLARDGQIKLRVTAERLGGFADAIALEVDGLPAGVTVTGTTLAAKQPAAEILFKTDKAAVIGVNRLTVRGTAKGSDRVVSRTAALASPRGVAKLESVLLAVAMPTPFKVVGDYDMRWAPRGSVHGRTYRLERNGFDGPVEIRLADRQARHLQGVTGPAVTVPAGATAFAYAVHLPPWMETGRTSRVCVMATGVVKDADGSEHVVSFTSTATNDQIVAVIEPGRLGLDVTPASVAAVKGTTVTLTARVTRGKGLQGPVKLELVQPTHARGVEAEPVTLAADQESVAFPIRFTAAWTGPLVLRATLTDRSGPVTSEGKLAAVGP